MLPENWTIQGTTHEDVIGAHRYASHHRKAIEKSTQCGCFCCAQIYKPSEIKEWIDGSQTAICPKCGVDAVLGDFSGYPITKEFLKEMERHWFSRTAVTIKNENGRVVDIQVADPDTEASLEALGFFDDLD